MKKHFPGSPILTLLCRLLVGGVFIYASLDKLVHPQAFAQAIYHYRLLPLSLLHQFAIVLPMVELVVGVSLIAGIQQRGAALIAMLLNLIFIAALASALARNLDISCGCFHTDGGHAVGLTLIWRDLILLIACFPILFSTESRWGLQRFFPSPSTTEK